MNHREKDFEQLLSRNLAIIYKVCRFYNEDKDDIQDLFQEIAARLWVGFGKFKGASNESTWVYRVALNTAINFNIKGKRKVECVELSDKWQDIIYVEDEEDSHIKQLYEMIGQLNAIDRSIILLYLDGKTHNEIADIIGLTSTNIGTKIQRIKEKLRNNNKNTNI